VVVVFDVKKRLLGGRYDVFTHNARSNTRKDPVEFARELINYPNRAEKEALIQLRPRSHQ
jgi:hypothetical protein